MEDAALAKFVNQILSHEGIPTVKNFPEAFSDGGKWKSKLTSQSAVCQAFQCPLRDQGRLPSQQVCALRRQVAQLEQDQCRHLFQYAAATLLLG